MGSISSLSSLVNVCQNAHFKNGKEVPLGVHGSLTKGQDVTCLLLIALWEIISALLS